MVRYGPWNYPHTPLWKIYSGLAAFYVLSIIVIYSLWVFGTAHGYRGMGQILYFLSILLIPVFVFGNRTWNDLHGEKKDKPE